MMNGRSKKSGFTMVEALVVMSISGVLISMGVAGLTGAVKNARVRDYALNTAAFLERVANDANRMSIPVCVGLDQLRRNPVLLVYKEKCPERITSDNKENLYDSLVIDVPAKSDCITEYESDLFVTICGSEESDDSDWSNGVYFKPRIGLSAAPSKMSLCIQYAENRIFGGVVKCANKNMIMPVWNSGDHWQSL